MHAETIDTGAKVKGLRAFGPPEVVPLDAFAGNESAELRADRFWTLVKAVSLHLHTANSPGNRYARLSWRAAEQTPFARVSAPAFGNAGAAVDMTFAPDLIQPLVQGSGVYMAPMPELVLLPGWTLTVDFVDGQGGDEVSGVRCYVQRYQLVDVEHPTEG